MREKKKEHLFGKHIMQHRAWVKLQYMENKNAVTLIIQYSAFLVDFLQKISEELCTIYHKLLVLLYETLDEGASTLISWARYLTNKQTKKNGKL